MRTELTRAARVQLASSVRRRYQAATSRAKKQILEEFIAVSGYHPKYAVHVLNAPEPMRALSRRRVRPSLYDEAARQALIVLWEASDRVCGKRLKPLLRILVPALERHGHLKLDEAIRAKVLAMSAATIDRLLRAPRQATRGKRPRRVVPEIHRRVTVRTFADWHEPPPGSMEMDLVAHCGQSTRGSYIHSLVLTDIASGWTECAPLVVRDRRLLVEVLDRIRLGLPFPLRALDVDNGGEFLNETMVEYCLRHGIELTRSRPYRKNVQAWIEQKNGAVVRKLLGYRRFEEALPRRRRLRACTAPRDSSSTSSSHHLSWPRNIGKAPRSPSDTIRLRPPASASCWLKTWPSRSSPNCGKSLAASIRSNCSKKYAPCRVIW